MSLKIPSKNFTAFINTGVSNLVVDEPFYASLAQPFANELPDLAEKWNALADKPVKVVIGVRVSFDINLEQFFIVSEMLAIALGLRADELIEVGDNETLNEFIRGLQLDTDFATPEIMLAYGYALASQKFKKKRDVDYCTFKAMDILYPIYAKYTRKLLTSFAISFPNPLPYSNLYKQVRDSISLPEKIGNDKLVASFKDERLSLVEDIKNLEFDYRLQMERQIQVLCSVEYDGDAIVTRDKVKNTFLANFNAAVNHPFSTVDRFGAYVPNHVAVESNYHSALMAFAFTEVAKMKNTYTTGEDYFGSIDAFSESLQKIKDSYIYLGTEAEINDKQKDLEEDVAYKIGLFYLSKVDLVKDTSLITANRNIGDLLIYWDINQENKKEVTIELGDQIDSQESELEEERQAQLVTEVEIEFLGEYEEKRKQIYKSEYADLLNKMELQFVYLRNKVLAAREFKRDNIEKRVIASEALKKIELDREFQAELQRIIEVIT